MNDISQNISNVLASVREFEALYNREPGSVKLLLVSKSQPLEKLKTAFETGQTRFGENYLQEALAKIKALEENNIEWHFIGAIQSNKTRQIAENFSWVQSVSDMKLAKRLNDQRPPHLPPLNICIQVNVSEESTKSGVDIDSVPQLVKECLSLQRLNVRGLMCLPAHKNIFREQRAEFQKCRLIYENLREKYDFLDTLSMGMSDDLEAAISEGSTMIRIGTKIFGRR